MQSERCEVFGQPNIMVCNAKHIGVSLNNYDYIDKTWDKSDRKNRYISNTIHIITIVDSHYIANKMSECFV